jgi:xanthine dehydrogenase accessory factor
MSFPANESDVLKTALSWLAAGHRVALATVVRTKGSAPRQNGSHIAVRDDGLFAGSVSAGCVEGNIIGEALAAMSDGRHRTLTFGVSDDGVMSSGLLCGGEIEIFVEPIN